MMKNIGLIPDWKEVSFKDYTVAITDVGEAGQIVVLRHPNINDISIEASFNVTSADDAQGVPHLMEHCLFGKTLEDKPLFQVLDELDKMGVNVNAVTNHKQIRIILETVNCIKRGKYSDGLYEELANKYSHTELLKNAATICYNLITKEIEEDYMEKEKNIIYSEMQSRFPGDAQNLKKLHENYTLFGGKFSGIGNQWYIKDVPVVFINRLRTEVFNPNNRFKIVIIGPDYMELHTVMSAFVDTVMSGMELNETNKDKYVLEDDKLKNMLDSCKTFFRPDDRSYQVTSLRYPKASVYRFKAKPVLKTAQILDAVITYPTFKMDIKKMDDLLINTMAHNVVSSLINEYYREEYPFTYGAGVYFEAWRHERKHYRSVSNNITLKPDIDVDDFLTTWNDFPKFVTEERINNYIDSTGQVNMVDWVSFLDGNIGANPVTYNMVLGTILVGVIEKAEEKIRVINEWFTTEENKIFNDKIMSQISFSDEFRDSVKDTIKRMLDNAKVSIFNSNDHKEKKEAKPVHKKEYVFKSKDDYRKKSFKR